VGKAILGRLQAAGHQPRLLVRNPRSPQALDLARQSKAELTAGNIHDRASLAAACRDQEAVIHLVGIISEIGENTFERVHHQGTVHVVEAAVAAGCRRFVHMSALGTRPGAVSRYHQSKWLGEEAVRNSGLDWTLFRPSIIYGPGDGFVGLFDRLSRWSPVLPLMGGGRSRFQPIRVEDVAACFVGALSEPRSIGGTYDLGGSETLTLAEIVEAILRVTGRRRFKLAVPWGMARMQAAFLEFVWPRLLHQAPPLNRDQLLMLQEDNVGRPEAARELFGLPARSFEAGLRSYLAPGR
jgi:NADH dehydrogenase